MLDVGVHGLELAGSALEAGWHRQPVPPVLQLTPPLDGPPESPALPPSPLDELPHGQLEAQADRMHDESVSLSELHWFALQLEGSA
jgi:hypothetical protein